MRRSIAAGHRTWNVRKNDSRRKPSRAAAVLALTLLAACGAGDDGGSGVGVEYFPAGGVSEQMRVERAEARLNLRHTAVVWLEAAGGDSGDTGFEDGVDELAYHFDSPTEVVVSLDEFEEAPTLVALDGAGNEITRVEKDSGDVTITACGEHTFRFVHPRAGDPNAEPILIFFRPTLPDADAGEGDGGGAQSSSDVATLKAGKDCVRCNLQNLSWNACPGVSLAGVNLSHADFTSAVLACQTFESKGSTPVLLTGAVFKGASLSEVQLKNVELTDANFNEASFDVTVFDSVTATSADFGDSEFMNSTFGAAKGTGSSARGASFAGAKIIRNSCLSTYDLRDADFTGAQFDSSSSVHGTWFAGANLFGVTFDGTKFQYDSILPDCGAAATCTTVTVSGLCTNCPCTADLGCLDLGGETSCVQNQGPVTLSSMAVCQRPAEQADPAGPVFQSADLRGVGFNGADLTNSLFASNTLDDTTNFDGAILAGVDFTQENLGKAVDLSGAFLTETTNFAGAVLSDAPSTERGVNLSCDLTEMTGGCDFAAETTEFKGANMQYARLNHAGLSEANLENTVLDHAEMVGADLTFASLKGASLIGATLGTSPGSGGAATLRGAYMINADLTDADMRSVDLTGAHIYGTAVLKNTLLDSADLTDAILAGAEFTDASLTAANFNGAQLASATFDGATLTNAKFDDAYLQGVDFSTAKSVTGMSLSNAAVSTTMTSTMCTLIVPGSWTYMEQDGTPYTFAYGVTKLLTDATVICPDNKFGPCSTGDSLCPIESGPFPPVPACTPLAAYCYENCETPPCYLDVPDPNSGLCPFISNCN